MHVALIDAPAAAVDAPAAAIDASRVTIDASADTGVADAMSPCITAPIAVDVTPFYEPAGPVPRGRGG
jgi:hypothetical protein